MSAKTLSLLAFILILAAQVIGRAAEVVVDCSKVVGKIRALHGMNNGPLDLGGTVDLSTYHRELSIPFTRLHDCHWPNPDVVDIHVVFPNFEADPSRPESYDFEGTDEYVKAIHALGSSIIYRLGESIEHTKVKRHVHPPTDADKWAAVCVGIIRHYNDGWAGGFHFGIRYWEIWNEPENRPNMWTGSDEDYFKLYAATSKAIKQRFPDVLVGGPGLGNTGKMTGGKLEPSPFLDAFLHLCREHSAPLDFFSWHMYGNDPKAMAERARGVRQLLDGAGFSRTESQLNEWNYLPDNDWSAILPGGQGVARKRCYDRIGSAEGSAFVTSTLIALQDAPLDMASYYTADTNPFGLFDRFGVPRKTFYAFKAFRLLLDTPERLAITGDSGVSACAGTTPDGAQVQVLVSNFGRTERELHLTMRSAQWKGDSAVEVLAVDEDHDLIAVRHERHGQSELAYGLKAYSICLVRARAAGKGD